jgi:hypothetical protein
MNHHSQRKMAVLGMMVVLIVCIGCAVTKPSSDPWTTHYVGSPDQVWTAIHISLVDLDYDVESENREDGLVRAVRKGDDGTTVVLSIDQIMRNEEVKVYVRAAAGPDDPEMGWDRQEKNAKDFLALVNGLLYK